MSNTKKCNGEGSIFKLPNGKLRAVISYRQPDGKRKRRGRLATSRAEAATTLRQMQNELDQGRFHQPAQLTLSDYLGRWLEDVIKPEKAENTYYSYQLAAKNWITPAIGGVQLQKLSPIHVQSLLTSARKGGAGDRTTQNAYVVLNAALGRAVQWELLAENPCRVVDKPKAERDEIHPFTQEEAELIMTETEHDAYHALYVLAITTGMRQGEMFGLERDALDLKQGKLHVRQQAVETCGRVSLKKPKTKTSIRWIELTDRAIGALHGRRAVAMRQGNAGSPLVFCSQKGSVMRRSDFRVRQWNPLLRVLGLEHRGLHHLRHTYATRALGSGVPAHVVSRVLGHSKPSITLDIYAHVLDSQQAEATEAMRRLFG